MLHYITSCSASPKVVLAHARDLCVELTPGVRPIGHVGRYGATLRRIVNVPHLAQAAAAETILKAYPASTHHFVVASMEELPILRILREVGQGRFPCEEFVVTVLDKDGVPFPCHVDPRGEFREVWPEGFFDGRMPELFYNHSE